MSPFSNSRSSTRPMSKAAYLASFTPSATFSKSQNTAMFWDAPLSLMPSTLHAVVHGGWNDRAEGPLQPAPFPIVAPGPLVQGRGQTVRDHAPRLEVAERPVDLAQGLQVLEHRPGEGVDGLHIDRGGADDCCGDAEGA